MRFSVIVCAYTEERWHDLEAAIQSLHAQTIPPHEIIVIIDHNPALLERIQQADLGVIAGPNTGARGLSSARNSGIAAASGDIVAFLDDDACAAPDWLETLAAGYETPDVIGIGGMIEPRWAERMPRWFPAEFLWVVGCTYQGMPVTTAQVRNLIGCNMSFRRDAITPVRFRDGVGMVGDHSASFRECEETEFCIRLARHLPGKTLRYDPRARVTHRVAPHRTHWRYFCTRAYAEGLSKALLTRLLGEKAALSSERGYTFHTLPHGIARGIADTFRHGDPAGLLRALAIIAGFAVTTAGFIVGTLTVRFSRSLPAFHSSAPEPEICL